MITLEWFVDDNAHNAVKAQKCAKALDAIIISDGSWQKAVVIVVNPLDELWLWWAIYKIWGVNSHAYVTP